MKSYYFISGLPRSGSTLLSAILKQNPDFYADISSPLEKITESVINDISDSENNFLIDEEHRKNIMTGIFEGYYKNINKPIIFDTSRKWTRKTNFLKFLFPNTKIICLVRDIISILNSFEMISSKNPFHRNILTKKNDNIFSRCYSMVDDSDGIIADPWLFLQEGYALNPDMILFVEYEDLCKDPESTMKKIYEFIDIPYYFHNFSNIEYSNESFDNACNLKGLHTVRKEVNYTPKSFILPEEIINKYTKANMEFWRKNCNSNNKFIKFE
jgi:sulfotransferase